MEDSKIVDLYWQRSEQAISETKMKYDNLLYSVVKNILSVHEYAEKKGISIRLADEYEAYEYIYVLTVAEENVLTYSIEKKSLDSGETIEKNYVIYSKELYDLVMERTMGGDGNEK